MSSILRRGLALLGLTTALLAPLLGAPRPAHAEPPMMKEHAVQPRIQAISDDGRFSVSLGGFVQGRYTLVFRGDEVHLSQFSIPRTRFYIFGHVFSKNVRYRLMVGTPHFSPQLEVFDAYVEWQASEAFRLRGGHFKIPVFREWIESARLLSSVERSLATDTLLPGRDTGIMISGDFLGSRVEYAFGIFNDAKDTQVRDSALAPLLSGRIVWNLMARSIEGEIDFEDSPPALTIGFSGYSTFAPAPSDPSIPGLPPAAATSAGGFELAYRAHGLDVSSEIMAQHRRFQDHEDTIVGAYARADQYIPSIRSSLGVRASRVIGIHDQSLTRTELDIDAAYYPSEHDLKVATNIGLARIHDEEIWEPFAMVQAQAAF